MTVKVEKKTDFTFDIPELIEDSIDLLVNGLNANDSLSDCYMAELYNNINNCLGLDINEEQADEIRDYYIRGGMYGKNN